MNDDIRTVGGSRNQPAPTVSARPRSIPLAIVGLLITAFALWNGVLGDTPKLAPTNDVISAVNALTLLWAALGLFMLFRGALPNRD